MKSSSNNNNAKKQPPPKEKPQQQEKKPSEFLCKVKYYNNLPDIPLEPKLLKYPFDPSRLYKYAATTLEKNNKHVIHTQVDLGIPIDLIENSVYRPPPTPKPLEVEDIALVHPFDAKAPKSRIQAVRPVVPWLRKTEYITAVSDEGQKVQKEDRSVWKQAQQQEMAREEQIQAIEETFETMINFEPKHPTKPELVAVETFDIFPNFDLWPNQYNQVIFDSDPAANKENDFPKDDAILKGFATEAGNLVAYTVPKKRKRGDDDDDEKPEGYEEEYEWIREYNYKIQPENETYFFSFANGYVNYNPITHRVNLTKSKALNIARPSSISIKYTSIPEEEKEKREESRNGILQPDLLERMKSFEEDMREEDE